MSFTPFHTSKQRFLVTVVVGLLSAGAAQATDLYDSLKIWKNQAAEAQRIRAQRDAAENQLPGQSDSGLTNPNGPQGPIRSDMSNDQPSSSQEPAASQDQSTQSDDARHEPIHNNPQLPSP